MPKVYNKRNRLQVKPLDAVLVDRTTQWGNLFRIGRDGTRAEVIAKFEALLHQSIYQNPDYLKPLRGKDLVCWCAPESCHADVLMRLANQEIRPFVIRSNQVSERGFRVVLCKGNILEDGSIWLTWTGNQILNLSTGQQERVQLCDQYASMNDLLAHLQTKNDVRCVYWRDTKEYQYINKR